MIQNPNVQEHKKEKPPLLSYNPCSMLCVYPSDDLAADVNRTKYVPLVKHIPRLAAELARPLGVNVLALTGEGGGLLSTMATVAIRAPEHDTYLVQELHLPIYHCLCAEVEERIFGAAKE